jgi:hypothetical protein
MRTYWSPISPDFVPSSAMSAACLFQTKELLVLGVVVVGHENRTRRRLRVIERIGAQPGCESGSVLVTKASFEKLRRLLLTIEVDSKPTVTGVAVVDSFLSCQSGKAFGGNPEPACLGVLLRATSSHFAA